MKRHIPVQIEWHPDPAQAVPVYRQILEWMYGKMESGEWPAGTRLPSQREMARHFQVNRSTLNQALKPLLEAGVLQGRGSQGTVIASTAWSLRLPVQPDWNRYMTAGYFRANQEVVQAINTLEFDDRLVRLGTGELDPRLFPQDAFRQTLRDVADAITSLGYVEPLGMPALRQALAGYARKRNSIVAPSSILITSGALQGLQLISAGLLRGGATVYVEDPTYVKSLQVFQSAHLRLCGLPMDDQGLSLEALEKHLRQSSDRGNSVLYTIPTNHNPTGRTLSRRRRIQLLELCSRYDLPIIEDGAYEELTFDGTPPPSLKSLDPGGRGLYLGSVSKSLAPGLRIGWMIAPEPVVQRLGDVKMQIDYGASSLSQQVLARFLTSGRYEQYL
uniref:aminotransferase-like domain-containing protein n=1 Tax=Megasphaera sp. TaxID=2023260 RepID=UPI0040259CF8